MTSPIEQHLMTADIPLNQFGSHFSSFRKSAFRLELLPTYNVEEESSFIEQYSNNPRSSPPAEFNADWHEILTNAKNRNAIVRRCRVIDDLTNYQRFEFLWGYRSNIRLGEEIHYLNSNEVRACAATSGVGVIKDFWLFDNEAAFFLEYDFFGSFLGAKVIKEPFRRSIVEFSSTLWQKSNDITPKISSLEL